MAGRLFVFEFERQVMMPLTPEPGRFFGAVWSPDATQIAYSSFARRQPPSLHEERGRHRNGDAADRRTG